MEIPLHQVRLPLSAVQIGTDISYHADLCGGGFAANRVRFDILIKHFIRIQLRAIGRQLEQLNLVPLFSYELLYRTTAVDRMSIDDKIDLPFHLLQQPLEKSDHHVRIEPFSKYHESQRATVANAADHVAAESLAGAQHNRRLTFR